MYIINERAIYSNRAFIFNIMQTSHYDPIINSNRTFNLNVKICIYILIKLSLVETVTTPVYTQLRNTPLVLYTHAFQVAFPIKFFAYYPLACTEQLVLCYALCRQFSW